MTMMYTSVTRAVWPSISRSFTARRDASGRSLRSRRSLPQKGVRQGLEQHAGADEIAGKRGAWTGQSCAWPGQPKKQVGPLCSFPFSFFSLLPIELLHAPSPPASSRCQASCPFRLGGFPTTLSSPRLRLDFTLSILSSPSSFFYYFLYSIGWCQRSGCAGCGALEDTAALVEDNIARSLSSAEDCSTKPPFYPLPILTSPSTSLHPPSPVLSFSSRLKHALVQDEAVEQPQSKLGLIVQDFAALHSGRRATSVSPSPLPLPCPCFRNHQARSRRTMPVEPC